MSAPDLARGFLRVPCSVWLDVFCRAPLTRRQLQLVAAVLRESWGWRTADGKPREWTGELTPHRFFELTGLSSDHTARDLRLLVRRGILEVRDGRWRFEPDPARWLAVPAAETAAFSAETAVRTAETAARESVLKKRKIRKRNVASRRRARAANVADR